MAEARRRIPLGWRIALWVVGLIALAYFWSAVYLYERQGGIEYDPDGKVISLSDVDVPRARTVSIAVDGLSVQGWYAPPEAGKPVIVYYKGNAGSVTAEYKALGDVSRDGYGFLAIDYRGFPFSPGQISQQNILDDAMAAFDFAAKTGYPLVIWGDSLGTAPATYVASKRSAKALILESPFTSALDVAQRRYWFLPVKWLMSDQYPLTTWLKGVDEPVMVAHGKDDATVPVDMGEKVYDLAPDPRVEWIVPGAGHADLWARGLWTHAKAFLSAVGAAN
jgi:uncharacterized protein